MTCAELRERLADPASGSLGGHAPVVSHLEECPECREAMRTSAAIDRLFRPIAPVEPPADFDHRVRQRMTRPQSGIAALLGTPIMIAVAAAAALAVVTALWIWTTSRPGPQGTSPIASARRAASPVPRARAVEELPPPDILAVRSTPLSADTPPLTEAEKAEALSLLDFDFLQWVDTLAGLDAFFPEPIGPREERAPSMAALAAVGPPATPDGASDRLLEWRRMTKRDHERLLALEDAFRKRAEPQRVSLAERWRAISTLSSEEKAGLKRLAGRMRELEPRQLARLEAEVRTIATVARGERSARWRVLPFSKGLTGQEVESAEKLLLAR